MKIALQCYVVLDYESAFFGPDYYLWFSTTLFTTIQKPIGHHHRNKNPWRGFFQKIKDYMREGADVRFVSMFQFSTYISFDYNAKIWNKSHYKIASFFIFQLILKAVFSEIWSQDITWCQKPSEKEAWFLAGNHLNSCPNSDPRKELPLVLSLFMHQTLVYIFVFCR